MVGPVDHHQTKAGANHFELRHLSVRPGPDNPVVSIDAALPPAGSLLLRGPSGSGKTTLLRTVARLRTADSGEALLEGVSWKAISPRIWRRRVAYAPSRPQFLPGTVRENMELPFRLKIAGKIPLDAERMNTLLHDLLLPAEILKRDSSILSDGERARLALIRALLAKPAVLLTDEPTAALDPESAGAVHDLFAREMEERGMTIVAVAHNEAIAERLGAMVIDITGGGR